MNWIPVNFDHVHYSKPHGVPYFWDPKYPQWIQIVESTWVSKHISWVEPHDTDEELKKIVQDAERLMFQRQSAVGMPDFSQRPTLPSLAAHFAKTPSESPYHEPFGRRRPLEKQQLPASNSEFSTSARNHSFWEASQGGMQPGQTIANAPRLGIDYYSLPDRSLQSYGRLNPALVIVKEDICNQSALFPSSYSHYVNNPSF